VSEAVTSGAIFGHARREEEAGRNTENAWETHELKDNAISAFHRLLLSAISLK